VKPHQHIKTPLATSTWLTSHLVSADVAKQSPLFVFVVILTAFTAVFKKVSKFEIIDYPPWDNSNALYKASKTGEIIRYFLFRLLTQQSANR